MRLFFKLLSQEQSLQSNNIIKIKYGKLHR